MSCNRSFIDAHFAADLAPRHERILREHLADCADCRRYYERHLLLQRLDPASRPGVERLAAGLGIRRRRRWIWVPALATAAALVLLMVRAPDGMTARGKPVTVESSIAVRVASSQIGQAPRHSLGAAPRLAPLGSPIEPTRIRASDELAFSYRNPEGYARLMIFGVDEHGHVYWYFPAWLEAAADPVAVPIEKGVEARGLGEAVAHDLDAHRLQIHALFTNRPLTVRQVEARVRKGAVVSDGERHTLVVLEVAD